MDEQEFAQLNLVPLVDVMLVILAIVLTTSTFIAKGLLPVDLPRASQARGELQGRVTLDLDATGATALDGQVLSRAALARRLAALERSSPVLIRSDRETRLQVFIDLLDLVKGLGFRQVSVQTQPRAGA